MSTANVTLGLGLLFAPRTRRAHMLSSVLKLTDLTDGLLATSIVIAPTGMANTLSPTVLE